MSARAALIGLALGLAGCSSLPADGPPATPEPDTGPPPLPLYPDDPGSDRTLEFYFGPMKPMVGETILHSIAAFTGHGFGGWDFTAPEPVSRAFVDAGNSSPFYRHCRLLGGCMEHRIPLGRTSFVGTAYVLELERAVVAACDDPAALGMFPGDGPADPRALPIDVIRHQYRKAFGEEPTDAELELSEAYFEGHVAAPERGDVSPLESAGRGHCRALLTSNRFLFY